MTKRNRASLDARRSRESKFQPGEGRIDPMREHIDRLLIQGLDSGEPIELKPEDWSRIRREVRRRVEARRSLAQKDFDTP